MKVSSWMPVEGMELDSTPWSAVPCHRFGRGGSAPLVDCCGSGRSKAATGESADKAAHSKELFPK